MKLMMFLPILKQMQVLNLVRLPGFEPGYSAWEADVLPS